MGLEPVLQQHFLTTAALKKVPVGYGGGGWRIAMMNSRANYPLLPLPDFAELLFKDGRNRVLLREAISGVEA